MALFVSYKAKKLAMKIVIGNMLDKHNYRIKKGMFCNHIRVSSAKEHLTTCESGVVVTF
jgi:hypothetical protein